jgi:hypothetical protein
MTNLNSLRYKRTIAACLAILMAGPLAEAAPAQPSGAPQQASPSQQTQPPAALPDNGGSVATAEADLPQAPSPAATPAENPAPNQDPNQAPQLSPRPSSATDQQNPAQAPVGTAAAPVARPTGVAGSRPAGAVIAPGKQRRVHTFLIRTTIIIAAAAAVGTVVALSKGSPSRPQ